MRETPFIKICGVKTPEMALAAAEAGATHVGLVFFPPSPRALDVPAAQRIASALVGGAAVVALLVDGDDAAIDAVKAAVAPDYLQLHGQETPARARDVRRQAATPIIKAVGVATPADVAAAQAAFADVDLLLFDAKPPPGASRPGGHGAPFDWSALAGAAAAPPWALSGGLTPETVADAAARAARIPGFRGVDVSSGVEAARGKKDAGLVRAFVEAAQSGIQGV
ncbi:MAG: phosphoribosylanthranilate isomerase [Pseudomonadota bacterium]